MLATLVAKLDQIALNKVNFFINQLGLFYWQEKVVDRLKYLDTVERLSFDTLQFLKCTHEFFIPAQFKPSSPHLQLNLKEQELLRKELTKAFVVKVTEKLWFVNHSGILTPILISKPEVVSEFKLSIVDFADLCESDLRILCKLGKLKIVGVNLKNNQEVIFITLGASERLGFELVGKGKQLLISAFLDLAIFVTEKNITSKEVFLSSPLLRSPFVFMKLDSSQRIKFGGRLVPVAILSSISSEIQEVLRRVPEDCRKPFLESCQRWGKLD